MTSKWKWGLRAFLGFMVFVIAGLCFMRWYVTSKYYIQRDRIRTEKESQELKKKYENLNVVLTSSLLNREVIDVLRQLKLSPENLHSGRWITGEQGELVEASKQSPRGFVYWYYGSELEWTLGTEDVIQVAVYFPAKDCFKRRWSDNFDPKEILGKTVAGLEYYNSKDKVYEFIGAVPLNEDGGDVMYGKIPPPYKILRKKAK